MPPRWTEAVLQSSLRPTDRESISGDLLEEYRAVRIPALGRLRANLWYAAQIISLLWPLIRPAALVIAAQAVFLALTVFRPGHHAAHPPPAPMWVALPFRILWFGSIVGTPGISLFDAAIYFFVAYRGANRTGLIKTGGIVAVASSFAGLIVLFSTAAIVTPGLAIAPLTNPTLLLILAVYLIVPLSYAALVGTVAGTVGHWHALHHRNAAPPPLR
jgi:hypothetical protein